MQRRPRPSQGAEQATQEGEDVVCGVCHTGYVEDPETNQLLFCDGCDMVVHQACYGIPKVPTDDFLCTPCKSKRGVREDQELQHAAVALNRSRGIGCITKPLTSMQLAYARLGHDVTGALTATSQAEESIWGFDGNKVGLGDFVGETFDEKTGHCLSKVYTIDDKTGIGAGATGASELPPRQMRWRRPAPAPARPPVRRRVRVRVRVRRPRLRPAAARARDS